MANPKHKHSRARRNKRRHHLNLKAPGMSTCQNCGAVTQPHRACTVCGYYKGISYKKEKAE
jgi:large subunit ribosomal protein L32